MWDGQGPTFWAWHLKGREQNPEVFDLETRPKSENRCSRLRSEPGVLFTVTPLKRLPAGWTVSPPRGRGSSTHTAFLNSGNKPLQSRHAAAQRPDRSQSRNPFPQQHTPKQTPFRIYDRLVCTLKRIWAWEEHLAPVFEWRDTEQTVSMLPRGSKLMMANQNKTSTLDPGVCLLIVCGARLWCSSQKYSSNSEFHSMCWHRWHMAQTAGLTRRARPSRWGWVTIRSPCTRKTANTDKCIYLFRVQSV